MGPPCSAWSAATSSTRPPPPETTARSSSWPAPSPRRRTPSRRCAHHLICRTTTAHDQPTSLAEQGSCEDAVWLTSCLNYPPQAERLSSRPPAGSIVPGGVLEGGLPVDAAPAARGRRSGRLVAPARPARPALPPTALHTLGSALCLHLDPRRDQAGGAARRARAGARRRRRREAGRARRR